MDNAEDFERAMVAMFHALDSTAHSVREGLLRDPGPPTPPRVTRRCPECGKRNWERATCIRCGCSLVVTL